MPDVDYNRLDYTDFLAKRRKDEKKVLDIALYHLGYSVKPENIEVKYIRKGEKKHRQIDDDDKG